MAKQLTYLVSQHTHYNSDHETYETYVGVETRSGDPGEIHYKACGSTEAISRGRAEILGTILTSLPTVKK